MDKQREDFEKWYVEEMKSYAGPLSRIENGQYLYVESLWRAYQAGSASLQPAQEPVGHVDMQTPGPGDRIRWTNGAMPHGTPLYASPLPQSALSTDAQKADFYRGVIAALGALAPHSRYGGTEHDEIVRSVGKAELYAVAEPEDIEWAGLDPEFYATVHGDDAMRIEDGKVKSELYDNNKQNKRDATGARLPNGACVTNVYDAYTAGLEEAANEMARRKDENANTPDSKAAYANAERAIRALQSQSLPSAEGGGENFKQMVAEAIGDIYLRMRKSYEAEPVRRITFMDMEAVFQHVAKLGLGGCLDAAAERAAIAQKENGNG